MATAAATKHFLLLTLFTLSLETVSSRTVWRLFPHFRNKNELKCYVCSYAEGDSDKSCLQPTSKTHQPYCTISTGKWTTNRYTYACVKRTYTLNGKKHLNRTCDYVQDYEEMYTCPTRAEDGSEYLKDLGLGKATSFEECYCKFNCCNDVKDFAIPKWDFTYSYQCSFTASQYLLFVTVLGSWLLYL